MDSEDRMYSVRWICAAITACCLICSVAYYNISDNQTTKEKQIEFAKAGLVQKVELTGTGSKVIWVRP